MDTIIAATDFSKPSVNALKYSAALTVELNAQLLLVHVIELPITPLQVPLTATEFEEIEKSVTAQLDELKEQLLFYVSEKITISTEIKYGFVEIELDDLCKKINPLAVVIGLSSRSSSARFFLGNATLRIIPYIQCPVIIIPENAVFSGIKNIAITSDSEHIYANTAAQFINTLLNTFHVQPDIIHVQTKDETIQEVSSDNIFLKKLFSEHNPVLHTINNENVEEGVIDFIREKKPDLLVVTPGKYNFLKKLFRTSNSKQLILNSNLPVINMPSSQLYNGKKEKEIRHEHDKNSCKGCDGLCCQKKQIKENRVNETHSENNQGFRFS